jgi:hypothetical protein
MDLKERIIKNREKFELTNTKYNVLTDRLLDFLGEDLFSAPASNMESMYNAFPGGLVDYILKVTKYGINLNDILPEDQRVNKSSIIKVCFLHQLGKVPLFKFNESEWHRTNQGKMYEFNEDIVSMRVSERSVFFSLKYGVELTEEEYQSIINYDKSDDDKQSKWYSCTLSHILRIANELAILECKNNNN